MFFKNDFSNGFFSTKKVGYYNYSTLAITIAKYGKKRSAITYSSML